MSGPSPLMTKRVLHVACQWNSNAAFRVPWSKYNLISDLPSDTTN